MKRLLSLLLLALGLSSEVWAKSIDNEEALQIATRFFAHLPSSTETSSSSAARRTANTDMMRVAYTSHRDDGEAALYVINRGVDDGFIIVSGDDNTDHPVLGWSDNGSFDYDRAPVQLKDILESYRYASVQPLANAELEIDGVVQLSDGRMAYQVSNDQFQTLISVVVPPSPKRATMRASESAPNVVVAPLVKVQWDQVGEYAKYVDPYYDTYAGVAAGCVPTAMAQLMSYWKYPARGRGSHLHNVFDVPADINMEQLVRDAADGKPEELRRVIGQYSRPYYVNFSESVYKWNEMGGSYPSNDTERDNVAKLIFDCHVSCSPSKMLNGRGTASSLGAAAVSMIRYFGYSPEMQRIKCQGNEDLMRKELDAGRPILMEGSPNQGYSNETHAFVCDGYTEDGYFHFNFGWSGSGDGYYILQKVNPVTSDFSVNQTAFIGICPSVVAVEEGQAFVNVTTDGVGVVVGGYGNVVVPATVEKNGKSYPVMKVMASAFDAPSSNYDTYFEQYRNECLTCITLPESVTEIGAMAFPSNYLTEVNLPSSIRKIGANAFFYSRELKKVSIPSVEAWLNIDFEPYPLRDDFDQYMSNPIWNTDSKYEGRLYIGDKEATDIIIPASVKEVKPFTFCGYQFLNSVTIEEGVEKIGTSAFERVPLKQFNLPSTVKEIGAKAFFEHHASVIKIPAGLTRVGTEALNGNYISEYIVDENNPKYSAYQGVLYDKSRRTLVHCPNFRPGFREDEVRTSVGVPSTVTSIRAHSFGNNLTKLILPPSVKSIEDEAFVNTIRLKDLYVYTRQPLPVTASMFHLNAISMFNKVNVHVPLGAGDAYRAAPVWQDMNIVEDQAEDALPPEHYDYTTDYNALDILDWEYQNGTEVGKHIYILFDSQPVITHSGTSILVTTTKDRYVFEKEHYTAWGDFYMRFVHYDAPMGIDDVKSDECPVVYRIVGDRLIVSGLDAGTSVVLYSLNGRQLASAKASSLGEVGIGIPTADIIVVKAGNNSFKIHAKR